MSTNPIVMISSTVKDLPDYRSMVQDACLRADTFPEMMEQLSALNADAVEASLAMVDKSDIYIGIFAHKYGYIPEGYDISITEMEYNRAVERGIPILIFIISDEVAVKPKDFEIGQAAVQLHTLKEKLKKEKVVAFFESPKDLRGLVIDSLHEVKKELEAGKEAPKNQGEVWAKSLHYTSEIPAKPKPFIAHPYTLLQLKGLIGRKKELEILTDWITKPRLAAISIFNVVVFGCMGKSALTWHWFNHIAPQEKKWAGRVWWSFYETDATLDNFVTKTLAYVSGIHVEELKALSAAEKQDRLSHLLNNHPYLIVLDGLERILIAYARQDAAFLNDDNALDDLTANRIAGAMGLPQSSSKSFFSRHRLRRTTDSRIGHFLRKLSQVRNSKILVSTRLFPADLQTNVGKPYPHCFTLFLTGLSDQNALELWRAYGAQGSREEMLPVFQSFDKHPLLLQLLASEVAEFRMAPGDFDAWRKANPGFNVFGLPLVQVQSHVLSYALSGLSTAELQTLQTIAGFRMPASMTTLKALLLAKEEEEREPIFTSDAELDKALTILEDKGLLGWDRRSNRYDLHPIVRGVVWKNLAADKQYEIHGSLRGHFEAMPIIEDYTQVESIEDLRPAIELYNSSIEMKLYDEAYVVFRDRLNEAAFWRLSANNLRVELLERLFVDGVEQMPALDLKARQAFVLSSLASGYDLCGLPDKAIPLYVRGKKIRISEGDKESQAIDLSNLSEVLRKTGKLYMAEVIVRKGLSVSRKIKEYYPEVNALHNLGQMQTFRGDYEKAKKTLKLQIGLATKEGNKQNEGFGRASLSQTSLLNGEYKSAKKLADKAWALATAYRYARDFIRAAYCQGLVALRLNHPDTANERLHFALKQVRAIQAVNEELQILIALAELYLRKNELEKAREYLDDVWDRAKQGPYPLLHADALNILAQIEIAEHNKEAAITVATEAYQKAWCDGPPYAYDYSLKNAKRLLQELGAPEPEMPPFDPTQFEPMPEVEIDPEGLLEGE